MNISLFSQFSLATVSFKPYSRQELKKSSVLEVTNPVSFDALGHPTKGGLHDPVLGPSRRDDICETCNLGGHGKDECPGHFGHISLPVPIYNPFFIRQMFQMLSMCCFSCHHLLFHPANLEVVLYQLQALDYGLDYLVDELQSVANDLANLKADKGTEFIDFLKAKLSECIENALKQNSTNSKNDVSQVRNVIDRKQTLTKALLQGKLVKILKNCSHCNNKRFNMSLVNNSMVLMSQSKSQPKHYGISTSNDPESSASILKDKVQEVDSSGKSFLTPLVARDHLRKLYKNETEALKRMLKLINIEEGLEDTSGGDGCAIDVFFMDMIPVTPPRFRPLHMMGGKSYEDETTTMLTQIILASEGLKNSLKSLQNLEQTSVKEKTQEMTKLHSAWGRLQILCNRIYDSEMDKLPEKKAPGVRQILEKKEGLFRKNMMGKRVNYAARSVISPDPYISVDEIGIPEIFATRLSYPQPVTPWNVEEMKKAVINGPSIHPGALSVTLEDGSVMRLRANDPEQRARIANLLGQNKPGSRTVNRHLVNGDILLLNRQPTLHKPSIMAHKARVLKREKTLRLHYSNCKCYNADFDGDEMNAHFPQSELARSEAYNIVSVNKQYLVPKDGSPLGGLIQDHIVSATLLTMKGNFFNRKDYQQLVFSALFNQKTPIKLVKPTIWRPVPLWSGKQIITTLIINLVPPDKAPPTLYISSKVNSKTLSSGNFRKITVSKYYTPEELDDSTVIIRQGEVLQGLIDKANIGPTPYGLIHICYELYGGEVSNSLLTAIARLCTVYLQVHGGVTLGIEDIIVNENDDRKRSEIIAASTTVGDEAATQAVGLPIDCEKSVLVKRLREWHASQDPVLMKTLDSCMKSKTDEVNNGITKVCLPAGLIKKFPHNNLQLMIQSGAKGGTVNALQISCLLGQIELEGKRVPLMMSGRTLPSFVPYDTSPKAGGFVTGRFLTGIRPQEFFFHCMAGREGLIDTAVKTSRSGYLQRCLIKHLEGLTVHYDSTVRDIDGSLVQLQYGEDGIDVLKSQLLKPKAMPLLIHNRAVLMPTDEELSRLQLSPDILQTINKYRKNILEWEKYNETDRSKRRIGSGFQEYFEVKLRDYINDMSESRELSQEDYSAIVHSWFQLSASDKKQLNFFFLPCPGPLSIDFRPNHHFGVLPEKMEYQIQNYVESSPDGLVFDPSIQVGDEAWKGNQIIEVTALKNLINSRFMKSLADPGESVGLLAAQSIGEPSTQMTLNTFHFAGRGDMNVTLGIPRLREILMTASPKIATPNMDIPFRKDFDENRIDSVRKRMSSVKLCDVLETIDVKEILTINESTCARYYDIMFKFLPYETYRKKLNAKPAKILSYMESNFIKNLIAAIRRAQIIQKKYNSLYDHSMHHREARGGDENEGAHATSIRENPDAVSSDEEDNAVEEDTHAVRTKAHRNQELDYEEPEEEEIEANKEPEEDQTDNITTLEPDEEIPSKVDEDEELQQQNEQRSSESSKEKQQETIEMQDDDYNLLLTRTLEKERKEKEMLAKKAHTESLVKEKSNFIDLYDYDGEKKEWCRVVLKFPLNTDKVDIASIVEEEARKSYIFKIGSIDKVFLVDDREASKRGINHGKMIKTEGVGFFDLVNMQSIFDLNRVYSNDIHAIANTYGIEAARKAITIEIANVFAVYGIEVDPRHLTLIADYMTFNGTIKGMNRISMAGSSSPLQQMTFETTAAFLKSALLLDFKDELRSPSARIFAGRPPLVGTGILGLMQDGTVEYNPSQHLKFKNNKSDSIISPKSDRKFGQRNRLLSKLDNFKRKHQSPNISIEKPLNKRIKFD